MSEAPETSTVVTEGHKQQTANALSTSAPLRASSSIDLPPCSASASTSPAMTCATAGTGMTSSKCTQTKLEGGGSDQQLQRSLDRAGSRGGNKKGRNGRGNGTGAVGGQDLRDNKSKEWKTCSLDELTGSLRGREEDTGRMEVGAGRMRLEVGGSEGGKRRQECKGERLRGSSTEVCPWEDE